MSGENKVSQKITLDGREYIGGLEKVRNQTRAAMNDVNKSMVDSGKFFGDFTNKTKQSGLVEYLSNVSKSFVTTTARGALLVSGFAGLSVMRSQLQQTATAGLEFGRAFSQLASRADLSSSKVKQLKDQLLALGKTGAALESLPGALGDLYGATGNVDKAMSIMGPVTQSAAMGDRDAEKMARFVTERLKGEGREVNKANATDLLTSLNIAQRGGQFANTDEAMRAFGDSGMAQVQGRAHVSDREMAAMVAAASRVGSNKDASIAAVSDLMRASVRELGGDALLAGWLGVGSLRTGGKFDPSKLSGAAAHMAHSGLSSNQQIEMLQSMGMSAEGAQGLLAILKDVGKFQAGMKRVNNDQKGLAQAYAESTDNLEDTLAKKRGAIVEGFNHVLEPFEDPAKKLLKNHPLDAAMALPGAAGASVKAAGKFASDEPLLAALGIGSAAIVGVLGKKFGLFGGGASGLAGGITKGKGLQAVGITPVFVVNASEIAGGKADMLAQGLPSGARDLVLGGAAAGIPFGAAAALAGAAAIASAAQWERVASGDKSAIKAVNSSGAHGMEYSDDNSPMMKLYRLFESFFSKGGHKMAVEVYSKDAGFGVRPRASDLPRNGRGP